MKLIKFTVEKFRSIILPSSFSVYNKTVLLGPNNEGKSNVLRALVFALEFIKEFAFHNSSYIKTGDDELIYEIPLLHRIRYEWHTDYPISNQKMFEPADEKHSTFILQFSFTSDHDSEFLEQIDLKEDAVISLKINAGYESAKISFCKENYCGNYSEFKQLKSICKYIASRIDICYIDAIRTIDSGKKNIQSLIDLELKEIYLSRKETKDIYCQELKEAYYDAKEFIFKKAELEYLKSKVGALGEAAIGALITAYDGAVTALENAKKTWFIDENSVYQVALQAFREKKAEFLKYKNYVASLEEAQVDQAILDELQRIETALTEAEAALEKAKDDAEAAIEQLEDEVDI